MNIVVTGGTKGIGKAIVQLFADKGKNIAFCSRNESDLHGFHQSLCEKYPEQDFLIHKADLSKKEDAKKFAEFVNSKWSNIDILINNAGLFIPGEIHKEQDGVLEMLIETNLYSAYHLTREILPAMIQNNKGHIFNMCSIASLIAYPNGGSYSISKFALLGFSKVLREEMKNYSIKVTSVLPGATWTESWAGSGFPEERLMESKDIALAIWNACILSPSAVVEEIILRPLLGDL